MINSVHFRRQVGAVMEILTKAAIAEIAKLVDDGSAVLRLEMYRTQSENETLKTRIRQMESDLEAALGRGKVAGAPELPGNTRSVGVQAFEEFKGAPMKTSDLLFAGALMFAKPFVTTLGKLMPVKSASFNSTYIFPHKS